MQHLKLYEDFNALAKRNEQPSTDEIEKWSASYSEWSEGSVKPTTANVIEFFQNNSEDDLYEENVNALLDALTLKETYNHRSPRVKLTAADERALAKDFTFDGKYAFDEKLSDAEKKALLLKKVEHIIKQKNLTDAQASKVRNEWTTNIDKIGVGQFEDSLKRKWLAADRSFTGGRVSKLAGKVKDEIWKGYKQPVAAGFDSLADIITGSY